MILKNLIAWHKYITKRDGYICQLQISPDCKKDYSSPYYFNENDENAYVVGDHLKRRRSHPELKLETANGKTACRSCNQLREALTDEDLPEGYLDSVEEKDFIAELSVEIFETGARACWVPSTPCKKCKKYNATASGLCMACRPCKPFFKKPKKEKK